MNIDALIRESIQSVLMEIIEGNTPDELTYEGEHYVVFEDDTLTLLYYNGKWLHNADTHRDIISLVKFGCQEWELEEYYGREKAYRMRSVLDTLWSNGDVFKYPSRIFLSKGKTREHGILYILISWDDLNEEQIKDICRQLNIDRRKLVYLDNDFT